MVLDKESPDCVSHVIIYIAYTVPPPRPLRVRPINFLDEKINRIFVITILLRRIKSRRVHLHWITQLSKIPYFVILISNVSVLQR